MLIEIFDISPLRNFFDIIYENADIIEMKLDSSKLSISLLNNSHVAFYNLEIAKEFFGDYTVDGEVESVLIFVEDFYKILKSAGKNDVLLLNTTTDYLVCKFEHDNNRRVFELPLAEEDYTTPQPPSIEYDGEFDVSLDDLKQSCNDLDKIIKTDKFKIVAQNGQMNVVAPPDAMTQYAQVIGIDTNCKGIVTINIQYIKELLKLSKINKYVTLKVMDDMPLSWSIQTNDELVKISGIIALIIEQED